LLVIQATVWFVALPGTIVAVRLPVAPLATRESVSWLSMTLATGTANASTVTVRENFLVPSAADVAVMVAVLPSVAAAVAVTATVDGD
jgi:hypothetical protein